MNILSILSIYEIKIDVNDNRQLTKIHDLS